MRKLISWSLMALVAFTITAAADLTVKDGGGTTRTIKNFVCETTKLCNATVLIASDGTEISPATSTQAGSLTETAPATDTASSGLNGRLQRISQRLTSLIALLPTSLGSGGGMKVDGSGTALPVTVSGVATAANQSSELTLIGPVTETAPASDTASSGVNGRLQRLAQRLTSLETLITSTNTKIDTLNGNVTAAIPDCGSNPCTNKMGLVGQTGTWLMPSSQSGTWTVQPGNTPNTTPWLVKEGDGTNTRVYDPCETVAQTSTPISITTATTTRIVPPASSKKTHICYIFLTSAAADNVGIVEGTGGTCGTGTAGVIGGTTAANGPNFAANGGLSLTAGGKTAVAATAGTNVDLCLITSAATPLAGVIKWVQL